MELLEIMGEDGFFKQLGLTQLVDEVTENVKTPQDHKKKTTKVSKK